ncbi:hypothetical protein ACR6C2_35610 [Streptomyces sp. INA 01156]
MTSELRSALPGLTMRVAASSFSSGPVGLRLLQQLGERVAAARPEVLVVDGAFPARSRMSCSIARRGCSAARASSSSSSFHDRRASSIQAAPNATWRRAASPVAQNFSATSRETSRGAAMSVAPVDRARSRRAHPAGAPSLARSASQQGACRRSAAPHRYRRSVVRTRRCAG